MRLARKISDRNDGREIHKPGLNSLEQDVIRMPVLESESALSELLEEIEVIYSGLAQHGCRPFMRVTDKWNALMLEDGFVTEVGMWILRELARPDDPRVEEIFVDALPQDFTNCPGMFGINAPQHTVAADEGF